MREVLLKADLLEQQLANEARPTEAASDEPDVICKRPALKRCARCRIRSGQSKNESKDRLGLISCISILAGRMFMSVHRSIDLSKVTLAVLAGGHGKRMGAPKARLELGGEPILDWLLSRMQWPGPTMLVTAPSVIHPPGCELFDREVVDPTDGLGPLRGVLTALTHLLTPTVAIVTVDMPGVAPSVLEWLVESLAERPQCRGLMCRLTSVVAEHVQPFPSVFRADAAGFIAERLASGRLSVQGLCLDQDFCALEAPADWPAKTWANLNTPADMAEFKARYTV